MPSLHTVRLQKTFTPLLVIFCILGCLLFGLALVYSDGVSTITVTPKLSPLTTTFLLRIGQPNDQGVDILPATTSEEKLTATVTATPTAGGALVDAHASGTMTVINTTASPQPLSAKTRFRSTNGLIVRSETRVDVPAKGQATVRVVADVLGTNGNLPPGKFVIVALWPGLQDKIYGQTSAALTGGQSKSGLVLDVEALTTASKEASDKIRAGFGPSTPGTLRLLIPDKVTTNPAATTVSATYQVTVTMIARTIVYDPQVLASLIRRQFGTIMPTGQTLALVDEPTVTTTSDTTPTVRVSANGQTSLDQNDVLLLPSAFLGKTRAEATAALIASGHIKSVSISIVPQWQRTLPKRADRIRVIVSNPAT